MTTPIRPHAASTHGPRAAPADGSSAWSVIPAAGVVAVLAAAGVSLEAQEPLRYHERTDGTVTISTPNGPIDVRSEHDAVIVLDEVAPDSLEAWYEELTLAALSPQAEMRPETEPVLGQRFVLRRDRRGHLAALETPDFPASFADVSDLTAQFFDFLPALPAGGIAVGDAWTDTLVAPPPADTTTWSALTKVSEYRVLADSTVDGVDVHVVRADAVLDIEAEGPVPNQPGLRVVTRMAGPESNLFLVARSDLRLVRRERSAELSGRMEYVGMPQAVVLDVRRSYTNTITLVDRAP